MCIWEKGARRCFSVFLPGEATNLRMGCAITRTLSRETSHPNPLTLTLTLTRILIPTITLTLIWRLPSKMMPELVHQDRWEWSCSMQYHGVDCDHCGAVMAAFPHMILEPEADLDTNNEGSDGENSLVEAYDLVDSVKPVSAITIPTQLSDSSEQGRQIMAAMRHNACSGCPGRLSYEVAVDQLCEECGVPWMEHRDHKEVSSNIQIYSLTGGVTIAEYVSFRPASQHAGCQCVLHPDGQSAAVFVATPEYAYEYGLMYRCSDELFREGRSMKKVYKSLQAHVL